MLLPGVLTKVLRYLRAGNPGGVLVHHHIPLIALMRRRLTDDDVNAIADKLMARSAAPVRGIDLRVAITKVTDELPSAQDTRRVHQRLTAVGRPVDDEFGMSD